MRLALYGAAAFVAGFAALALSADTAEAGSNCKATILHNPCGPAPNTQYKGGGYQPETIRANFCLSKRMHQAITQRNGRSWWDFGLYYGSGEPEEVATVRGRCRQQNAPVGDWVVAYINCPGYYEGWVYAKVTSSQSGTTVILQRGYPFKSRHHDPLVG